MPDLLHIASNTPIIVTMKEIDLAFERVVGLRFVEPDLKATVALNQQINVLSSILGKETFMHEAPTKGFLDKPLNQEQAKQIESRLGEEYANDAVMLQNKLDKSVKIVEKGERMVSLPLLFKDYGVRLSLSVLPFNEACGNWAGKERVFWARETVANKILFAGQALQTIGIMLHLEDGFRPLGVQEGLFFRRVKLTLQNHPEWVNDWNKIWAEARSKTAITPHMAGHKSGAALDITLQKLDGSTLPLGNKYPEGGPKVAVKFPFVTQEEWSTRQLFTATMEMAGLRIYPYENWHASYGDLSAGIKAFSNSEVTSNYSTAYGPIKGFDFETGKIEPYSPEEYFKPFYTEGELRQQLLGN